ncbi:MAG: hypothetical protein DWQ42_16295 [Planctomycetota bacterium]|nr:MAG: hypothetical protein DWQ42_16295 [Planctomycetota bacterium]REK37431.1 MAG: hypothetical protein DWQ46_22380 [Planctomycetota bacterium]
MTHPSTRCWTLFSLGILLLLAAVSTTGCTAQSAVGANPDEESQANATTPPATANDAASEPVRLAAARLIPAEIEGLQDFQPPTIQIPEGFELEIVAEPPLVKHPMLAAFDDRGRLFVAETDGQNLRKEDLLEQRPRFIRMLEDLDGDGRFDKSTIFADDMVMPEGALWHDGALYVISAPYLWRLEDTNDDGVADKREKLVGTFELNGNPNLTGPYLGPCGRIYFTGGVFGYELVDADGTFHGSNGAASVFSCRADGSDLQIHGQGPINPVEVMFTPEGELFTTNAIFDSFGGRHDALVHWIEGCLTTKVYGKALLPETGYRIPAVCRWGQVAPAGLMRVRNTTLSDEWHQNVFACQFNTHRVVRVELERHGSSFLPKRDEDFISSESIDFHPTDIFEDADGSLLMIDTGGWLYFGCPTSKIAKPNIYGAIYRLRQKGAPRVEDPRGLKLEWDAALPAELAERLDDARPTVRDRAIDHLARRGDEAVPALGELLATADAERQRRNAVWSLSRIGTEMARRRLYAALSDRSESVRQAAIRSFGVLRDRASVDKIVELYESGSPQVRLTAAEAIAKIGDRRAVPALLRGLAREDNDDYLMHAQIHALIRIDDFDGARAGLADENTRVRRSTLIALDQMGDERLTHDLVLPLLNTSDQLLRKSAIDVIGKRDAWAGEIEKVLRGWLEADDLTEEDAVLARAICTTFAGKPGIQARMVDVLRRADARAGNQLLVLEALAASDLTSLPSQFVPALRTLLAGDDAGLVEQIVTTISAKDTDQLDNELMSLSRDAERDAALRLTALAIAAKHARPLSAADFEFLLAQFDEEVLAVDRARAAEALASARLDRGQTIAVAGLVERVGPLELPTLLKRFERDSAPIVVNVDVQPPESKTHRGVAAYLDEPQEHRAIWNSWNPISGQGFELLRTSDGSFSGVSLSRVTGAELMPYRSTKYDDLLNDFVYSGLPAGGGEHQSFQNEFTISGLRPETRYALYFFGTAYPKPAAYRGVNVTLTDATGSTTRNNRGLRSSEEPYEAGITHVLFDALQPREDGTVTIRWTAGDHDLEGNFGILNGLTLVAPAATDGRRADVGKALVAALDKAAAIGSVTPVRLEKLLARYPDEVFEAAKPLMTRLAEAQQQQAQRLAELMPQITGGNPQKGREVFFSNKAACATCHRIRGEGAEVGPDLSLIGRIRRERDLLESIIYPSSTIANGYDRFMVLHEDGLTYDGVISKETVDAVYVRRQSKEDVRIPRDQIEAMDVQQLSLMPQGLEKQISTEQLRDLIAYLLSLK